MPAQDFSFLEKKGIDDENFQYKQFTSQRKPNEHTLQEHIIISSVSLRRGKKNLGGKKKQKPLYQSKEDLQFEMTPAILELKRTERKALLEKSTPKDPKALVMLKIQSNYLISEPRNKNT